MSKAKKAKKARARTPRRVAQPKVNGSGKPSELQRREAVSFSKDLGSRYVRPLLNGMGDVAEHHWIHTELTTEVLWPEYSDPSLGTPRLSVTFDLGGITEPEPDTNWPLSRHVSIRVNTPMSGVVGELKIDDYQLPGLIRALAGLVAKATAEGVVPGLAEQAQPPDGA